jgi:hypothetical protein
MKTNYLQNISNVGWGKLLLPIALVLAAIAGIFQSYEVQAIFFPENYHDTELKLIKKECGMIDKGFKSLQAEVDKLNTICISAKPSETGAPLSASGGSFLPQFDKAWPATLHAAKKKRVYVVRKLRYLNAMLRSMEHSIQQQQISQDMASKRGPNFEKTIVQIKEIQSWCETYNNKLEYLSEKLNQLEGCSKRLGLKD